ncbi:hypothetical protein DFS33DRAFT_1345763 [Desarmillaria ectypa]|nr:hypothetical protein DFS33DRAFT_1345763 [Desarmillaria ectypa]
MFFKQSILAAVALSIVTINALTRQATYFTPDSSMGACSVALDSQTNSVALASDDFGDGTHCGETIYVQYNANTVSATVIDECPSYAPTGSISPLLHSRHLPATAPKISRSVGAMIGMVVGPAGMSLRNVFLSRTR